MQSLATTLRPLASTPGPAPSALHPPASTFQPPPSGLHLLPSSFWHLASGLLPPASGLWPFELASGLQPLAPSLWPLSQGLHLKVSSLQPLYSNSAAHSSNLPLSNPSRWLSEPFRSPHASSLMPLATSLWPSASCLQSLASSFWPLASDLQALASSCWPPGFTSPQDLPMCFLQDIISFRHCPAHISISYKVI